MQRFYLARASGECVFSTPDGIDDDLADALHETLASFSARADTRLRFIEGFLNHVLVNDEPWWKPLVEHHLDVRTRVRAWVKAEYDLDIVREPNGRWSTRRVERRDGPVDHYMQAFTSLRVFFQTLIDHGIRPDDAQNPFERDNWHLEGEQGRWLYCVGRYGSKAAQVYANAPGAYFLPGERRPYHRSLFNPQGIGRRIAEAVRERSGDHVATNIVEIICLGDPVRFDDIAPARAIHWPDCGDTIMARNKGDGDEHDKPTIMAPETHANLCRRIDLDHEADPENRPSMANLRRWWADGDTEKLTAFRLFQKHPSRGDGVPRYNSVWELINKACRKRGVTVGRGAAERTASLRWARREKVDGRMLRMHREAKTMAELEKGREELREEMFWRTDQTGNYGSHAERAVATERKREEIRKDAERQAAELRGERAHDRAPVSAAVAEANTHAMQRPKR